MKKNYLLLFLFITLSSLAQFSKTHYIPPLGCSNQISAVAEEQYLYISTPSETPVNFKVTQLGGILFEGTVSKTKPYKYYLGTGTGTALIVSEDLVNKIVTNKGFIIEADDLIYASLRVIAGTGNQSGALVSKGLAALGKEFRIGALLNTAVPIQQYSANHFTFVSILATENNTHVQFSDIKPGVSLINNAVAGNTPLPIILNRGESFVMAVEGPNPIENRDGLIGSLVTSDKPIAVNCGSFAGSNAKQNLDLGFDQIVSAERTGTEYIFIKSTGQPEVERVLLVANEDNTKIFLNGNTTANYIINAGKYIALDGNDFTTNGSLYVSSSKKVFAYQTIGDRTDDPENYANQELFFVPPLSCETPHVINNIPSIEQIGTRIYKGRVTLIKQAGSSLNFEIDGITHTLSSLSSLPNVSVIGPTEVIGNTNYTTYIITGLTGNLGVFSSGQLYLAAYGTDASATFGGFYSGFTFKPEISFGVVDITQQDCIPNKVLTVNTLAPFDIFQWYYNDLPISGATKSKYTPTNPGYYYVKASISGCGTQLTSDKIPVSLCPTNSDNDLINDNLDIDINNDGITNCNQSLGNKDIDLTDTTNLNINTFGSASNTPFTGNTSGDFVTETGANKNDIVTIKKTFTQPTNILLQYVTTANSMDLLNDKGEFIINSDINKTVTVLNPDNQLLIDTNFDGIYESGVTQYSSFEIRFRLNSTTPLAAGLGKFSFQSSQTTSFSITHKNLSETNENKATFKLTETCVNKDSDLDGVPDAIDFDTDNDGLPNSVEIQGINSIAISNTDSNLDGLDDAFGLGINPVDSEGDGVVDYLDLDSDNDGIYDVVECGSNAKDTNLDGRIDGSKSTFGTNGLANSIETFTDSGILNFTIANTNSNDKNNYLDLDSDSDGCLDTVEAGFSDSNNDGILGDNAPTVDTNGKVTNANGYVFPNTNYITYSVIVITNQPTITPTCELENAKAIITTTGVNSYQWQVLDAGIWTNLKDNLAYSGSNTNKLVIYNITTSMRGTKYRVILKKNGNSCSLISDEVALNVLDLPIVTTPVSLIQCDDDAITDGYTYVNLRQKESFISSNNLNEKFTYYSSKIGAINTDSSSQIGNPTQFKTTNSSVWVRVENKNFCYSTAQLDLTITSTKIPSTFHQDFYKCDDLLDSDGNNTANNNSSDGIASFDFSPATAEILKVLPPTSGYSIKYYKNATDAASETDALGNSLEISQNPFDIINIYNYRNIGYPHQQDIWVRIESDADNSCFGLGPYVKLTVEPLPIINPINATNVIRHCDDNQDGSYGFDTSTIQSTILNSQTNVSLTYFDENGKSLSSPLPNPFIVNKTKTITVKATNNKTQAPDGPCTSQGNIQFIVDVSPRAFPVLPSQLNVCDDIQKQDGIFSYETSTFESTLLNGQTGMILKYFDEKGNPLSSPLPNPFKTTTQNIKVIVENPINPVCTAERILPFIVQPLPQIDLNEDGSEYAMVCLNQPDYLVTLDAGILGGVPTSNFTYKWYLDGIKIPNATSSTLKVNTAGNYSVDVSNSLGCFRTRNIKVLTSEKPSIDSIKVIDLIDSNTLEIITSGTGDFVYSLDLFQGFQTSNIFTDVPSGIHQVYVKDMNGCGIVGPKEISILGIPKFFTPNNDGINDTWNVNGINGNFNKNTIIQIYDHYGKLLKQLKAIDEGWDGNYNGYMLPADDYWYIITFDNNKIVKGHFSLKR